MIELKNVSFIVDGKKILDDVSIKFFDNTFTAITGQNGSGKSTLTKLIIGILQPTSGTIKYNGKDITNLSITERVNLGLNYAFQQPVLFKGVTIKDLIDIATKQKNSVTKACEYLSKVGICAKEYVNRCFDKTLSGGEQKRVELALSLAKPGDTLIFDEPEAGIDIWSFEKLSEIFKDEKCYIVVSHQEKLLSLADNIVVLNNGKIELQGKPKRVLKMFPKLQCKRLEV